MKIDIDFDEIMRRNLNAAISASVALADKNPEAAGYAEQFERFAKISANITIGILRDYHAMLEKSLGTDDTIHWQIRRHVLFHSGILRNPLFSYLLSCLTSCSLSLITLYLSLITLSIVFCYL